MTTRTRHDAFVNREMLQVCDETGGTYKVAATAVGMKDLVLAHTKPAAILAEAPDGTKVRACLLLQPKRARTCR